MKAFHVLFALAWVTIGCDSSETKQCRAQYAQVHAMTLEVDTAQLESVEKALELVTPTLASCQKAQLHEESEQLEKILRKLESHRDYLVQIASRKELSPAELDALVKNGDPGCPKGTSYKYEKSGKTIRCSGPQLVDMNWEQVENYFRQQRYKITHEGSRLKAESGSVSYSYSFDKVGDSAPASCVVVFTTPGIPWEESASRLTGVSPRRIQRDKPIQTATGERALHVEEQEIQAVLRIGQCS